jgi:hypothetical protein
MPVTDDQLELLETYLDGELPADQEETLRKRLQVELELAAAMESLKGERETRAMVWQTCEPSDAAVHKLVMKIEAAVDRQAVWAYRFAKWRIPSAAAACILLGFLFGWVGRGTSPTAGNEPGQATMIADTSTTPVNRVIPPNPILPLPVPNTGMVNVSNPLTPAPGGIVPGTLVVPGTVARGGPVDLPIVDQNGHVVAVQRFKSAEEAARFVEDLSNWQKTQDKIKGGNMVPAGSQKF